MGSYVPWRGVAIIMKRFFYLFASVLAVFTACRSNDDAEPAGDGFASGGDASFNGWQKVAPMDLEIKPIELFAKDWMALGVGNSKSMNAMTIAWGTIGELWNKHVVIVYVSSDRYTKKMMDKNAYFTVVGFPDNKKTKDALVYIGTHSYRDDPDKVANAGLTPEYTELGNPIFMEGNLAIECKKIYSDKFNMDLLPYDVKEKLYSRMGIHSFYIGEIVNIWEKPAPIFSDPVYIPEQDDASTKKN